MYNEKDIEDLVEMLYPYFIKKYKEDQSFKQTPQIISAKLISLNGNQATVVLANEEYVAATEDNKYYTNSFNVPILTTEKINAGDYVYLMYWNDLKNAKLIMKG